MKRNVLPFGIIAIVGIFAAVIVFYIGVDQRNDIASGGNNDNGNANTEEVTNDPEAIFANQCASCHGDDLSGGAGPDLTAVGSSLSADDIKDVIDNGQGTMPGGLVQGEEAELLAEWISEKK